MKAKIISIVGLVFFLLCAGRIYNTYQVDKEEAVFESFLLAAIAGYHGVTLRQLNQQENKQQT